MKNRLLRLLSFIFAFLLVLQIPLSEVSALDFTAGANPASSSYKSGKYYENLTSLKLTGDGRTDVLAVALSQLGYQESNTDGDFSGLNSGSSNYTEFNYNFGDFGIGYGGNYAWCAAFVSFCLLQAKTHSYTKMTDWCRGYMGDRNYIWREISCNYWADQLRLCGYFRDSKANGGSYQPQSGDLIFFADGGVGASETHIGIVLYSDSEKVYTVEGNTSSADGLEANGGGVYLKSYALDRTYIKGYGVLPYKVNSAVPKIDYSGVNITPGVYAASTNKYVYETENASDYKWLLKRGSMFTVTEICSNGRVKATCKIDGETVTGYIMNNSDRIVQLSPGGEYITHIEVTTLPKKTTYFVGDSFQSDGMVVTAYYSTGKTKEVTDYTVSGYTATEGTKTITVTSGDYKASFEVAVIRDTLTKIEITSMPEKTVYFVGEDFDSTGMVVTATFDDGSSKEVSDYTVSGYSSAAGYKRITIKYGKKSASFMVTVKENVIEKTELSSLPYKLEYTEGEVLSLDGLVLSAVYSDGSKKIVTDYTVKDTALKEGKNTIVLEYSGFEVSFEVTVTAKGHTAEHITEIRGSVSATCTEKGYTGDIMCLDCGEVVETGKEIPAEGHNADLSNVTEASCTSDGYTGDKVCTVCDEILEKGKVIPRTEHTVEITGKNDPTCHSEGYSGDKTCTVCSQTVEKGHSIPKIDHVAAVSGRIESTCSTEGYTGNKVCNNCGVMLEEGGVMPMKPHNVSIVRKKASTCSAEGFTGDTVCTVCGEHTELGEIIPKKAHTEKTTTAKATLKKNGSIIKSCTVCGQQISKTTLYRVKTVKLEKAMFVYNGKNPAVSVTVKDSKGKKLKKNTDYKVKLASLGKKVGTYKVTVTFTGNYTGEKVLSFEVVPKGTSISKLTSSKKGFTVKWKKQTKETTGYEIQYSTSRKFTKKTTKTLTAKSKSTSKKVQKLKAKKTYYVRIRTYKTVKGKKLYSAWSSVKSVKTK